MPAREGAKNVNVAIPEHLLLPLEKKATDTEYAKSKSKVICAALESFLGGTPEINAVDQFHQHLASVFSQVVEHLQTQEHASQQRDEILQSALHNITTALAGLQARIDTLERRQGELIASYDRLKNSQTTRGFFSRKAP